MSSSARRPPPARTAPPAARTLAEALRTWSDEQMTRLLTLRPDLGSPAPQDSGQVASRAATRASVLRALDDLTRLELAVLDAAVVLGHAERDELLAVVNAERPMAQAALEHLMQLALVWDSPSGLRALSGVSDALRTDRSGSTSGLRAVVPHALTADQARDRVAQISDQARALLVHVADSGGEATTGRARTPRTPEEATTPVEEVLAHGLLVPSQDGVFHLPGQVGLALRGGKTTATARDDLGEIVTTSRQQSLVDRVAAGAAFECVRRTELLLDHWGLQPPGVLRTGGLAVKDLKAVVTELHVDPHHAALLLETAAQAGLLAQGSDAEGGAVWLPTHAFDTWSAQTAAERWLTLARTWSVSPRLPGLVGTKDAAGKTRNALAPDAASVFVSEARQSMLRELAALGEGECLATGTGLPSLVERLAWLRPRRPATRAEMIGWAATEAAALGLTGLDAAASYLQPFLDGDHEACVEALEPLLPTPVDHVLIQADLTAVAPGPLTTELARTLHLLADIESRGGATVYRFTPASVRRALDAGWAASEIHDFLAQTSRTPVPQPLTFLVDDVVRTFGTLRVGHAESFLRADDEQALTELLHHPLASSLGLRRLAPTVVISTLGLEVLLPRLRELGQSPVVEAADGTLHIARVDLQRARTPKASKVPALTRAKETARVTAVVAAIRAGDRAAAAAVSRPRIATTPVTALALLREAMEEQAVVHIAYVDNHGTTTERLVEPRRLEGGQLSAYDQRTDDLRTFAVHRITAVSLVDQQPN